jgi:hypothetical protein
MIVSFPPSREIGPGLPGIGFIKFFFLFFWHFGYFHQMLRICLKIHNYVQEITCKGPRCAIQCQPILHFGFLESSLFQVLLSKNQFPGTDIFIPAFLSREWQNSFPVETLVPCARFHNM